MRSLFALVALAAATSALAGPAERPLPFPDRVVSRDPYTHVEGYSTGAIEGMRRLAIDPAATLPTLKPTVAGSGEPGKLVIENPSSAWAFLTVSGVKIGQIGPFRTATLHGVAPGTYTVSFELPNGRKVEEQHVTR